MLKYVFIHIHAAVAVFENIIIDIHVLLYISSPDYRQPKSKIVC